MMNVRKILAIATLVAFSQLGIAAAPSPTAAVFDLGSLDTLAALGLKDNVIGVPKQTLPDYLASFNDMKYTDIGGLKDPNIDTLNALQPDIIVITGRQAGSKKELEAISTVKQVGASGSDYWESFSENIRSLASVFHAQTAADAALIKLQKEIEETKARITGQPSILVVTHNNGAFSLREEPIATQLLGLKTAKLPSDVTPQKRGARTFTSLNVKNIAEMKPTTLFIVDRSAAIGRTEEALDVEKLTADLAAQGAAAIHIAYLPPKLWYLSGNGLQSLSMQVKDIADAL